MIAQAISLREARRIARELGVEVSQVDGTGELLFAHPLGRARINARRHDASRAVVTLLRRVEAATAAAAG